MDRQQEASPLWRLRSGTFLGWRKGRRFYDSNGKQVGYFDGSNLYRHSDGTQVGHVYPNDRSKIGKNTSVIFNVGMSGGGAGKRLNLDPLEDVSPIGNSAWEDPDI